MNNRFRFRAWDKSFQKYCENVIVSTINGEITVYGRLVNGNTVLIPSAHVVLEQCTGLKDGNGELIYEGDVVDILCEVEEQGVIEWATEEAQFVVRAEQAGFVANFDNYNGIDLEVIGNIHENPELLEANNDK